jgi:hypothetical protein
VPGLLTDRRHDDGRHERGNEEHNGGADPDPHARVLRGARRGGEPRESVDRRVRIHPGRLGSWPTPPAPLTPTRAQPARTSACGGFFLGFSPSRNSSRGR